MNSFLNAFWIAALLLLVLALPALAHKVNLFAYVDGDTVFTESYFPDGRPVAGGKLLVLDGAGTQLLAGTTDQEGLFRFEIPKLDDLRIIIEGSMGHRGDFTLQRSELESGP